MSASNESRPTAAEFQSMVASFHGDVVRYAVLGCLVTPGVYYVLSTPGCWLITDIIAFQLDKRLKGCEWQWWQLDVATDRSATLTCTDGRSKVVFKHEYEHVVFPANYFELNVVCEEVTDCGRCRILVLPGED